MLDREMGLRILKSFWSQSRSVNKNFTLTFDEMLQRIQPNKTKQNIEIDGLGFGVNKIIDDGFSEASIDTAMRSLAVASKGQVPSSIQAFFQALSGQTGKVSWVDAIAYTAVESAKDVVGGAQALGDSLISTGKIINFFLPAIIIGVLGYIIVGKTKKWAQ